MGINCSVELAQPRKDYTHRYAKRVSREREHLMKGITDSGNCIDSAFIGYSNQSAARLFSLGSSPLGAFYHRRFNPFAMVLSDAY